MAAEGGPTDHFGGAGRDLCSRLAERLQVIGLGG